MKQWQGGCHHNYLGVELKISFEHAQLQCLSYSLCPLVLLVAPIALASGEFGVLLLVAKGPVFRDLFGEILWDAFQFLLLYQRSRMFLWRG